MPPFAMQEVAQVPTPPLAAVVHTPEQHSDALLQFAPIAKHVGPLSFGQHWVAA